MNSITKASPIGQSPFDSIRRLDEQGHEYWSARELMEWLGFSNWQAFGKVIHAAITDLELLDQGNAFHHIMRVNKLVKRPQGGGNDLIDYRMSRLGCYHVALACKKATIEVAAARRYFAVQTRKAEIKHSIPVPVNDPLVAQAELLLAFAKEQAEIKAKQIQLEAKLALEAQRTADLEQLVRQHDSEIDRIFNPNGHYFSVIGYARNQGLQMSKELAQSIGKKCTKYCRDNNIEVSKLSDPRWGSVGSYPEDVIAMFL
jgi:hypothetical protein